VLSGTTSKKTGRINLKNAPGTRPAKLHKLGVGCPEIVFSKDSTQEGRSHETPRPDEVCCAGRGKGELGLSFKTQLLSPFLGGREGVTGRDHWGGASSNLQRTSHENTRSGSFSHWLVGELRTYQGRGKGLLNLQREITQDGPGPDTWNRMTSLKSILEGGGQRHLRISC